MKNLPLIFMLLFLLSNCTNRISNQSKSSNKNIPLYQYEIDLTNFKEDKLSVVLTINPNQLNENTATFSFPKIVPGIYGAMDFGQYIENIKAFDKNGNPLFINKKNTNSWFIPKAKSLDKITYEVNDNWEEFDLNLKRGFYRSAASSFKKEVFVINNNCLFGYFEKYEQEPIIIKVNKLKTHQAATSLNNINSTDILDVFQVKDYHELVDNPILYAPADKAHIKLPNIDITVACYSTTGQKIAQDIANHIRPLIEFQNKYLNGNLQTKKYTFIIYHHPSPNANSYMGDGLEHSNSTLILLCMPLDLEIIKQNVYGIASHEFFHTVMPLGLHSFEIANYDFNSPKFSKHLWLYEGTTEYFTIHMPILYKVQPLESFLATLQEKVQMMHNFNNDIPITELSLKAMDMQDQYYNVYLKGALINLCLDIHLREKTAGKYGVQNLINDLLKKYGIDKPFEDNDLFEEIVKLSHPSVERFIQDYIEGNKPLPIKTYLAKVGINYNEKSKTITTIKMPSPTQIKLRKDWIGQ